MGMKMSMIVFNLVCAESTFVSHVMVLTLNVLISGVCGGLSDFVHSRPTYNHQIQQRFATLPLLQLSLDIDRVPGLSRGTGWGRYCRGFFPI